MIIGNGMLAKAFEKYLLDDSIVVFASGVSNSQEISKKNFDREEKLLCNTIYDNQEKLLVYFSTCSIEDRSQQKSKYIIHKKTMEELIKNNCRKYYIFRLPQVVGKTNSPTLINFLINSIKNENFFYVQKEATRNLIDVDDVFKICNLIIKEKKYINEIINIASPFNVAVVDIVKMLENLLDKKANYDFVNKGSKQNIDISKIISISKDIFSGDYYQNILARRVLDL